MHGSISFTLKYRVGLICKAAFILAIYFLDFIAVSLVNALSDGTTHTACLHFMGSVWGFMWAG
jgi:hypothetical protein